MKKGALVYNISQRNNLIFSTQCEVFVNAFKSLNVSIDKYSNAEINKLAQKEYDFVLFWDKDAYAAEYLENHGYRLFNKAETIRRCDDKALTQIYLEKENIPTPRTYVLPFIFGKDVNNFIETILLGISTFTYPLVVKERMGSFGEQVYLAKNEKELLELLNAKGTCSLLIQEFVGRHQYGEDYRVNIINGKVITSVKRINKSDFRSNVNQGGKMVHYVVSSELENLAIKAARAVGADFCGVDIILDKNNKPHVLEINSNARTLAVHQATGIDLSIEIAKSIIKKLGEAK